MPFTGEEGKAISPKKAKQLIRNYQDSKRSTKIKGGFYGRKVLLKLLRQKDCVGIRFFFALNARKEQTIVLVGIRKAGGPIETLYVDDGPLCPPWCDK